MPSHRLQCFVTPQEFRGVVGPLIERHGWLVAERINGPHPDAYELRIEEVSEEMGASPLVFPGRPAGSLLHVVDHPAAHGGVVLWFPRVREGCLKAGGVGIKTYWYEGEACHDNPEGMSVFRPLKRALERLTVGRTVLCGREPGL